jgi:hypothetical protein
MRLMRQPAVATAGASTHGPRAACMDEQSDGLGFGVARKDKRESHGVREMAGEDHAIRPSRSIPSVRLVALGGRRVLRNVPTWPLVGKAILI